MREAPPVAILTYHSLDDSGSVLSTPPRVFAEQMHLLQEMNVQVVPLIELRRPTAGDGSWESGDGGRSADDPPSFRPIVALTFDDGFQSVYEHAFPVLQRCGFTAAVFLVTDYCGKTNAWPGQPPHIERHPMLGWSEVRAMSAAGIDFGCHTRTHPDLRRVPQSAAEEELTIAKQTIEDAVGRPVETFAYPYGAYNDATRHLAQAHFSLACSARLGFAGTGSDPYALERLDTYYLRSLKLFRRLFSPEMQAYLRLRRALRWLRGREGGVLRHPSSVTRQKLPMTNDE